MCKFTCHLLETLTFARWDTETPAVRKPAFRQERGAVLPAGWEAERRRRPPGEQPAGEQPAGEQPAGEQPAGEQPAREQPAGEPPGQEPLGPRVQGWLQNLPSRIATVCGEHPPKKSQVFLGV